MEHPSQHGHTGHGHTGHHHGGHGMVHEPTADTLAGYQPAFDAAQPGAGGSVVTMELETREVEWEFVPGQRPRAWGYNGQVRDP